jgi:hypothetical protein
MRIYVASMVVALGFIRPAACATPPPTPTPAQVAVADFDYADTSGEVRDQKAAHAERLAAMKARIIQQLDATGNFTASPLQCPKPPCSAENLDQGDMVQDARRQHATLMVFGGVHKMSTLIQWGEFDVMDIASGRAVITKTITFRGDDADAWTHAGDYVAQMLVSGLQKK